MVWLPDVEEKDVEDLAGRGEHCDEHRVLLKAAQDLVDSNTALSASNAKLSSDINWMIRLGKWAVGLFGVIVLVAINQTRDMGKEMAEMQKQIAVNTYRLTWVYKMILKEGRIDQGALDELLNPTDPEAPPSPKSKGAKK